jgi:hypothetical protein
MLQTSSLQVLEVISKKGKNVHRTSSSHAYFNKIHVSTRFYLFLDNPDIIMSLDHIPL